MARLPLVLRSLHHALFICLIRHIHLKILPKIMKIENPKLQLLISLSLFLGLPLKWPSCRGGDAKLFEGLCHAATNVQIPFAPLKKKKKQTNNQWLKCSIMFYSFLCGDISLHCDSFKKLRKGLWGLACSFCWYFWPIASVMGSPWPAFRSQAISNQMVRKSSYLGFSCAPIPQRFRKSKAPTAPLKGAFIIRNSLSVNSAQRTRPRSGKEV